MDQYTTKPIEEITRSRYKEIITDKEIRVSSHAFDHLSEKQRKVYKPEELLSMIEKEAPRKIYLQRNGRYAVYFRKADGYRKLILEMENSLITIVTFVDTQEIPKLKLEND
jgi:hypothetical protein